MTNQIVEKTSEDLKELVIEFLGEFDLQYEGVNVIELPSRDNMHVLEVKILGEGLSRLVGRFGKTMYSFQTIINLAFNATRSDEERVQILIDVNGYREQRERELKDYAERALIEVRQNNLPMALPPMKPAERRIIHLALEGEKGIVTLSEGEGRDRYVVIKPQ